MMKTERKRIFISDLPEATNQNEIETLFKTYGSVTSVEIKHRKHLGPKNRSFSFAYVNIETDDRSLQRCFRHFAETEWHGEYVSLQVAKESFLDCLKRERQQAAENGVSKERGLQYSNAVSENKSCLESVGLSPNTCKKPATVVKKNDLVEPSTASVKRKRKQSLPSEHSDVLNILPNGTHIHQKDPDQQKQHFEDESDYQVVIKNKNKIKGDKKNLKIEATGNEPIIIIDLQKPKFKKVATDSVHEIKRSQSVKEKVKIYAERKNLIKQALSNVDYKPNNKTIFDEGDDLDGDTCNAGFKTKVRPDLKKPLFDNSDEEDDCQVDFMLKKQYEGAKGKKLLEMQRKFNNDDRFAMNEKFWDNDESEGESKIKSDKEKEDNLNMTEQSIQEEKQRELAILTDIIGPKAVLDQKDRVMKKMIRYDPNDERCSKLELKKEPVTKKKKQNEFKTSTEKKQEDEEEPIVSKERFYKLNEDLRDSIQQSTGFSLLSMFGQPETCDIVEKENKTYAAPELPNARNKLLDTKNVFKYDSSDEEITDMPNEKPNPESKEDPKIKVNVSNGFRFDPFFFREDDYRFQDGLDFIKRMASKDDGDFIKVRKELKSIVRSKVRNNQRRNKPFKKKLGGKSKKRLRITKALQR